MSCFIGFLCVLRFYVSSCTVCAVIRAVLPAINLMMMMINDADDDDVITGIAV